MVICKMPVSLYADCKLTRGCIANLCETMRRVKLRAFSFRVRSDYFPNRTSMDTVELPLVRNHMMHRLIACAFNLDRRLGQWLIH